MQAGDAAADPFHAHETPSSPNTESPPQPRNNKFPVERFLTVFAVASLATVPALVTIFIGNVLNNIPTIITGAFLFLIAAFIWCIAYCFMLYWLYRASLSAILLYFKNRRNAKNRVPKM